MTLFGWCSGPQGARHEHDTCPGAYSTDNGPHYCGCRCHNA